MIKDKKVWAIVAGACIILLATFGMYKMGMFGPSKVRVETVSQREMPLRIKSEANVSALNKATIVPSFNGTISQVLVKIGDEVQAGQLLAQIDVAPLQAQLAALENQLMQARTAAETRSAADFVPGGGTIQPNAVSAGDVERAREMLAAGIITQKEFDTISARAVVSAAPHGGGTVASAHYAELAGIESAMAQVQQQIAQSQLIAPITGRVSAIYNEDRKIAVAGRPFMLIQQMSPVVASLSIPQDFAAKLVAVTDKKTISVNLIMPDGGKVPGELTFVDTAAVQSAPSVLVKATFNNSSNAIIPGDFYTIEIASDMSAKVTAVPEKAVHSNNDGKFVYILTKENTVDVRLIEVGETVDGYIAITNGLTNGETIITSSGTYQLGETVILEENSK